MAHAEVLGNGLAVVTEEMPHMKSVSISIWIGAGSRYEDKSINGVSHFVEHMLFKGTRKREDNQKLSVAIEGVGGTINGFTNKEATCYLVKVPSEHFGVGLDVLCDIVLNSLFLPEAIEKERTVVIEEIRMVHDKADAWVHILLDELMWPGDPLGRSIAGTEDVIRSLSREDILEYVHGLYVPKNIVVSIAGNFKTEDVINAVSNYFSEGSGGKGEPGRKRTEPGQGENGSNTPGGSKILVEKRDIKQANFAVGLRAYGRTHPDRYVLEVLNAALGWGMSSRLFQEVRVRRGLAYAVGSDFETYVDTGLFKVYAGVDPAKGPEATRVVLDELWKIRDHGLSEEELRFAKNFFKGSLALRLEDTLNLSLRMGDSQLLIGRVIPVDEVLAKIEAVTLEDIKRVAADILRPDDLRMAAVGPFKDEKDMEAATMVQ
ncbi:MAG: insulinase family protein [Firmicutes bacterium]|nr:insulinase family protein [Bacillota bacterium]